MHAQMFGCRKKMSAIAILDYSGAEAIYHHMEALAQQGRAAWLSHNVGADASSAGPSSLPHVGSGLLSLSGNISSLQHQVFPVNDLPDGCRPLAFYLSGMPPPMPPYLAFGACCILKVKSTPSGCTHVSHV